MEFLEVLEEDGFFCGVVEGEGRVVEGDDDLRIFSSGGESLAVDLGDGSDLVFEVVFSHYLGHGIAAQRGDDLGLDEVDKLVEERGVGGNFFGFGIAVVRRTIVKEAGDEDLIAV